VLHIFDLSFPFSRFEDIETQKACNSLFEVPRSIIAPYQAVSPPSSYIAKAGRVPSPPPVPVEVREIASRRFFFPKTFLSSSNPHFERGSLAREEWLFDPSLFFFFPFPYVISDPT